MGSNPKTPCFNLDTRDFIGQKDAIHFPLCSYNSFIQKVAGESDSNQQVKCYAGQARSIKALIGPLTQLNPTKENLCLGYLYSQRINSVPVILLSLLV